MATYFIYHILGVKIGCSTQPKTRVKKQGYTEYEILERYDDPIIAGDRELELQKQYGYEVDNSHYWTSVQNRPKWTDDTRHKLTKEDCVKGGASLKGRSKSQEWKDKMDFGASFNTKRLKCPYCDIETNSGNYNRWHGEKCKKRGPKPSLVK